ncbi:MAG: ATP-dependent RecD-like DNA helicase [Nitrospinae bacterium]|nr:ATP-dependent RecD-like DNA helicase [Nitrospinota bacterium]
MVTTIQGEMERIVYANEENHFTIGKMHIEGRKELATVIGVLMYVNPGETLRLTGEWVHHKKFGEQFKIDSYISVVPSTLNGIEKYLASGLIEGIGPVMASRLVKRFGLDTINIIDNETERLDEVEGIGEKRIESIKKAWGVQKGIREVMIFLQGNGITPGYSSKIYKRYGDSSISIVKENPYRLASDISGIGFKIADRIAQNLGIEPHSLIRVEAGIIFVLEGLADNGHVCYPYEGLIEESQKILNVERDIVIEGIAKAFKEGRIIIEDINENIEEFKENKKLIYLKPFHVAEVGIAKMLKEIKEVDRGFRPIDSGRAIKWLEGILDIRLSEDQKRGVISATRNKVLVITGGPGTGKTTIVNSIIKIYKQEEIKILLSAPTGRAAKRLSEATGREAKTIHRLLEYSPRTNRFQRDRERPLNGDVIIIDEASMIDNTLMYYLLKAIPLNAVLILIGDVNQLPSVGAGNVLRDIINSGVVEVIELTEIFRQAKKSMIVVNAHRINQGEFPYLQDRDKDKLSDFYFIDEEVPEKVVEIIKDLCTRRIPNRFKTIGKDDIRVTTPMHKGVVGTENLNIELQKVLNPTGIEIVRGGRIFRINDRVMQIKNNYSKDIYNGDIGKIVDINPEDHKVIIEFDTGRLVYESNELDELILAYAVSVHKSQGSEYPAVIMPILTQHYILLQRNLLYTAVTRAKKLAVLVGTKKALAIALKNDNIQKRYTYLKERLQWRE